MADQKTCNNTKSIDDDLVVVNSPSEHCYDVDEIYEPEPEIEEQEEDAYGNQGGQEKRRRLLPKCKHATPGSGPSSSTDAALEHASPMCCVLDSSAADSSSVNEIRQNVYAKYMPEDAQVGDLKLQSLASAA